VKLTIMFRGREVAHPELGMKILEGVADATKHLAKVEASPRLDGRNMTMVLAPDKRAQADAARAAAVAKAAENGEPEPELVVEEAAAPPTEETTEQTES
jgi:translation initiation factor IF-3